ncbi:integral membrane protein [Nannizzia gypsea CBS 118893]|uniref:Integral membrane protein n=1 Tax=Arthroderma gypseum (strain ATCC MYA-4604 / CBS 118893) TaxID=535722 RepID=E4UP30_ARTGP|nr:integral membrane protein [Nannizzia gypsea CBS 118893]EFQ99783.1 integral membrane protein [Nannizzia gypsea CBS 118893]
MVELHAGSSSNSSSNSNSNRRTGSRRDASATAPTALQLKARPLFSRAAMASSSSSSVSTILLLVLLLAVQVGRAALVPFRNCLPDAITKSNPVKLQFTPLYVAAHFNSTRPDLNLNVTVYGNVSGTETREPYPPPDDPRWSNPNETLGKIVRVNPSTNTFTTLFPRLHVVSFTAAGGAVKPFCDSLTQGECPLGPVFNFAQDSTADLRAFSTTYNITSSYAFTSLLASLEVKAGDASGTPYSCVVADIAPDLGDPLRAALAYVPLAILLLVGVATVYAAIYSPWGTTDVFRWTCNYGRDEDLIRLVTPGFADCLQYIQFIVLTGSLTLSYPGYYQPVVSQAGWSVLMFNQSFVSKGNGTTPLLDGVYSVNGTYGLDRMGQFVGMTQAADIWAGTIVWLLVILASVTAAILLGFGLRWLHHSFGHVAEQDLQSKNTAFTMGNIVRIVFNFFLLPLVSLSMFQLVVAGSSPVYVVALAVILLVLLVGFAAWLLYLIFCTRPRSYLFDDLPTVLLYGPLYNTFSDGAAPFALISVLLTCMRGVAIGAVQPSGIAQIAILAICEVTMILTLIAFRPFESPTSMNAYHTVFALVRCLTILLCVAFVPSLDIPDPAKGWVGYVILILHGMVLIFGFFLNAIQTLIEVVARQAGAGGEAGAQGEAARGGLVKVFGVRQLSRRTPRKRHIPRRSTNSEATMLNVDLERPSTQLDSERPRSFSGSSAALLNRPGVDRASTGFESGAGSLFNASNPRGPGSSPYTPTTPGGAFSTGPGQTSAGGGSPRSGIVHMQLKHETADPYYRPPRQRRATLEGIRHTSWTSSDMANGQSSRAINTPDPDLDPDHDADVLANHPVGNGSTPTPAYLGAPREDPDGDGDGDPSLKTDYAVREVDFYYRVRGPALSHSATRKLKTGPADPTGPVSSASGWLKSFFGGKTKDKGKGFEVVRSSRAPPQAAMQRPPPPPEQDKFTEPYKDDPDHAQDPNTATAAAGPSGSGPAPASDPKSSPVTEEAKAETIADNGRPILPPIVFEDAIELPSRTSTRHTPSDAASAHSRSQSQSHPGPHGGMRIRPPTIPRKSSKRGSSVDLKDIKPGTARSFIRGPHSRNNSRDYEATNSDAPVPQRTLSNRAIQQSRLPFGSKSSSTHSAQASIDSNDSMAQAHAAAIRPNASGQPSSPGPRPRNASASTFEATRRGKLKGMGYVQQHRASDHIHETRLSGGSAAEFIGDHPLPPTSTPAN